MRCDDSDSRRYFSELIGTHEEFKASLSKPFSKDNAANTPSVSFVKERVNIIEPHQLGSLESVIVISEGHPFWLQKISMSDEYRRYYKEFTARTSIAETSTCDNSDIQEEPQIAFSASVEEVLSHAQEEKQKQEIRDMLRRRRI